MNNDSNETIFCFDSSALITLHNYYWTDILDDILEELETLFSNGRIVSHKLVFDELTTKARKPDDLSRWISQKRQYFKNMTGEQAKYVASIIKEFPKLIDPNQEKDQADPWLIAQILEDTVFDLVSGKEYIINRISDIIVGAMEPHNALN